MKIKKTTALIWIIVSIFLMVSPAFAGNGDREEVRFGRYPAPSPNGKSLAFSWAGCIWTVPIDGGSATKLTSSAGYDWCPIWSPDGKKIAFMSNRYGNEDVFIIDAKGGTPERTTFASNNDLLSGWLPDGSGIIYSSRHGGPWPDDRKPYVVRFEAARGQGPSAPEPLLPCPGLQARIHPDGDKVVFTFGPGMGYREGYKGTHKEDLWIFNRSDISFTRLTENDYSNIDPQWSADGSLIYYRSEEMGVGNLFSLNPVTGEKIKLTNFSSTGLWHPSVGGPAGSEIVAYEYYGRIFTERLHEGNSKEIEITAWLDEPVDTPYTLTKTSGASDYAVSPDGKEMAFTIRGELFCRRTDGLGGDTAARLTDSPARDWQPVWYPSGDAILFTSDRDGVEQLYRVISDDPDHPRLSECRRFKIDRLTSTADSCTNAIFIPTRGKDIDLHDYSKILVGYTGNTGDIWLMDGNGHHRIRLFTHWGTNEFSFSPDGRWIAYSRDDDEYNADIFITAVDPSDPTLPPCPKDGWQQFPDRLPQFGPVPSWEGGEVNITRHPHEDYNPIWSPDGSKLGFSSSRNMGNTDVYFIWLKRSDDEKSNEDWEVVSEPLPPPEESGDKNSEEENEKEKSDDEKEIEVAIDFENIHLRARRLTSLPGSDFLYDFSPDGKEIVYTSNNEGTSDILKIKCNGEDNKKLVQNADPRQIRWEKKPDLIYFISGGNIKSVKSDGGNQETHSFSATILIDPQAERKFKFNEIWRLENNQFYDSNFHGKDWGKLRDAYEPIALSARHYRDFGDAVNIMLGRLNASHLYYGDSSRPPSGPESGYLGCVFTEGEKIGLLINSITPHSPIDKVELGIKPGARIVSINGYGVGGWGENPIANYWRALEGTLGVEIELEVIDEGATDTRWIRLVPTDYYGWNELEYQAWMERNNRKVEELSGGRLGYMHIEGMYEIALERFEQDLYTVGHDKNGVIIDVRYNSGGWTTDWLLAMLDTRRHALTQARNGGLGYPQERTPVYTFIKPVAVLCNQWSFSNAEIFSHAIQQLDRGILVGWPTAGGVISTGGTSLADGSYISLPRRGWWAVDPDTLEIKFNLENHAAVPDVLVDLTPKDVAEGTDPQLEAAVKALMTELGLEN